MRAYRIVWLTFTGALGALGAVIAFTWSLSTIILILVLAALMGAAVAVIALESPDGSTRSPRDRRRTVTGIAAASAGGTLSFIGLGTLLGAATAVLLLAIIVGGSPYAIRYGDRWLREHGHLESPAPRPVQPDRADRSSESLTAPSLGTEPAPESKPHAPEPLSDEALCLAWRTSFSALQRASSPTQRLQIVGQRQEYLDEIERRSAHGLAAWLASGPRAAGDLTRFVVGDNPAGHARIDWDDLLHDTDQ